jgi:hypothetical protein
VLRELHRRVQQTDHAVLHDTDDSHRSPTRAQVGFERAWNIAGRGFRNGQERLSSQLLVQGLTALTPGIRLWG